MFTNKIPHLGSFYPNFKLVMKEEGDLAHNSNKALVKNTFWQTDKIGYRNDNFFYDPDILLIGDSFIVGSGLNQSETITNKISKKLGNKVKVYNMAPSSLRKFDILYQKGIIKKPRIIIYSIAERNIPETFISYKQLNRWNRIIENMIVFCTNDLNIKFDRMIRFYSVEWLKSRIQGNKGHVVVSPVDSDMFFLYGKHRLSHSLQDLKKTLASIISYKEYCESNNIDFLFLPMPDKETVYYDFVPLDSQPDYLLKLDSLLKENGISTINTIKLYNKERTNNNILLYHYDDTHWNPRAVEIVADEIIKYIDTTNMSQVHLKK